MKNTHTCPKCGNTNIIVKKGYKHANGDGSIMLGKTSFSSLKIDHYICANCGFIEQWIQDVDKLQKYI